jgi:hypothetical protein
MVSAESNMLGNREQRHTSGAETRFVALLDAKAKALAYLRSKNQRHALGADSSLTRHREEFRPFKAMTFSATS